MEIFLKVNKICQSRNEPAETLSKVCQTLKTGQHVNSPGISVNVFTIAVIRITVKMYWKIHISGSNSSQLCGPNLNNILYISVYVIINIYYRRVHEFENPLLNLSLISKDRDVCPKMELFAYTPMCINTHSFPA